MSLLKYLGEAYYLGKLRYGAFLYGKRDLDDMSGKEIIIWGTGKLAHRCFFYISRLNVAAFCDNNPSHWGKKYMGLPIMSPDEAYARKPYFVVCTTGGALWSVARQILARYCDDYSVFFLSYYGDYFDNPDLMGITVKSINTIYAFTLK